MVEIDPDFENYFECRGFDNVAVSFLLIDKFMKINSSEPVSNMFLSPASPKAWDRRY